MMTACNPLTVERSARPDEDSVGSLLKLVPEKFVSALTNHQLFQNLIEISMDVGRKPKAYFRPCAGDICFVEGEDIVQIEDIKRADSLMDGRVSRKNYHPRNTS